MTESAGTTSDRGELDRSFLRSLAWTGGVKWSSQIIAWAATLIVARILTPEDYGLVGMATVYLGLVALISEFGLGTAVVMLRELSDQQIAQLNGLAVSLGIAAFLVSCMVAVPLGRFFASSQLPQILVIMGLGFIITSFATVPASLLQRELRFQLLSLIDGTRALVLSGVTVILALLGLRYWTLVWAALLSSALGAVLTLARRRHALAWPRPSSLKQAARFSWHVLVSRLAWYTYSNADFAVAGRVLGQNRLGTYTIAWNLANAPIEKITNLATGVSPAYLSAVGRDYAGLRRYLLKPTEAIAFLAFPLMVGLSLVAGDAVPAVLGDKWEGAIPALRILALYACVRSLTPLLPPVLIATGDSAFVMWNSIAYAVVMPPAFYIGSRWGIQGIALAWVLAYPIVTIPMYLRLFRRIELRTGEYLRAIAPATVSSVVMGLTLAGATKLLPDLLAPSIRFGLEVFCGAAAYSLTGLIFFRQRVQAYFQSLKGIRHGA